jgi:hypothetical protein
MCESVPLNALVLTEPINFQIVNSEAPQKNGVLGSMREVWAERQRRITVTYTLHPSNIVTCPVACEITIRQALCALGVRYKFGTTEGAPSAPTEDGKAGRTPYMPRTNRKSDGLSGALPSR